MHSIEPLAPLSLVLADCAESVAVERTLWELATRLPRDRYDVRVWLPADPAKNPLAEALAARAIHVDRLPNPGATWSVKRALETWSRLRRAKPRLLHLHFTWPSRDGVSRSLTEMAGVPHRIVSAHGGRTPETSRGATRSAVERTDVVTTSCEVFADQLVRETGLSRDRIRRIPAGVDEFDSDVEAERALTIRQSLDAGLQRPLWVFAGKLDAHRGAATFLEALGIARERGTPFVAAIAGEGPLSGALAQRIDELSLRNRVHLLGPDHEVAQDIGALIAAADAVISPALWDGMSSVMLQALVRGRPVVASAVGGAPDAIENGVSGRLVPPGDARALADALASFQERADLAARFGREAARRSRDVYVWPRVVEAYEAVYDEVLGLASFAPEATAVARGRW